MKKAIDMYVQQKAEKIQLALKKKYMHQWNKAKKTIF